MLGITDVIGAGKGLLKKFNYGPHPSVIMWSNSAGPKIKETENIVGTVRKKLETILAPGQTPEDFQAFKFDAVVSEDHASEVTVTKFPTSSGFVVSDHIIRHNRVLKISAVAVNMQNSSMWAVSASGFSVLTGAIFNNPAFSVYGSVANTVLSAFETQDRIRSTFELFQSLQSSGTMLYISTINGIYTNCIITKVGSATSAKTGMMLSIDITVEELQVVDKDNDSLTTTARNKMNEMSDYSGFAKVAASIGVGVLGGMALPGLGSSFKPSDQLKVLKSKLGILRSPVSAIKGRPA